MVFCRIDRCSAFQPNPVVKTYRILFWGEQTLLVLLANNTDCFELKTSNRDLIKNKRQEEVIKNVIYDLRTDLGSMAEVS